MSTDLYAAGADYLKQRRARGYLLKDNDYLIRAFLDGLAARGETTITVVDAVAFATQSPGTSPTWHAARLRAVRGLAAYVHSLDPEAAELVPAGLIRSRPTRRAPYLYSDNQVRQLMITATALSPVLLAASIHTLIGLLASTGTRSGEAGALDVEDLRLEDQVMTVTGKYSKQRLVPLHPTTVEALGAYLGVRAGHAAPTGPLLIGPSGGRLNLNKARAIFQVLVGQCRLAQRPGCGAPRLHDFRHTFAVKALIDAHRRLSRPLWKLRWRSPA